MRFVCALCLCALCLCVRAHSLGLGLEAEFSKNLTECVDDENDVLSDFALASHYIQRGIDHISVHDIEKGLDALGKGIFKVRATFEDCGVMTGLQDLEAIAKDLQGGALGWVKLIAEEVLNVLSHRKELGYFLRAGVKTFAAGDYYLSGVDFGCFTAILIEDKPTRKRRASVCKMQTF